MQKLITYEVLTGDLVRSSYLSWSVTYSNVSSEIYGYLPIQGTKKNYKYIKYVSFFLQILNYAIPVGNYVKNSRFAGGVHSRCPDTRTPR